MLLPNAVLVTGAASGIGRGLAAAVVEAGSQVVGFDVDAARLAMTRDELGEGFTSIPVDLTDVDAIAVAVDSAFAKVPSIGGLVNCAGIYPVTGMLEMEVSEWDAVLGINLRAPFLVSQAVARRWVAGKMPGNIVNVSSTASQFARPGVTHYGSSKAGLNQLTRDMAIELAPHSIRVNAVAPGVVMTEKVRAHAQGHGRVEHAAKVARIPLGREAEPDEIVQAILWLLSSHSSYCVGSVLFADGGFTLGLPRY